MVMASRIFVLSIIVALICGVIIGFGLGIAYCLHIAFPQIDSGHVLIAGAVFSVGALYFIVKLFCFLASTYNQNNDSDLEYDSDEPSFIMEVPSSVWKKPRKKRKSVNK